MEWRPEGVGRGTIFQGESILAKGVQGQRPRGRDTEHAKASVAGPERPRKRRVGNEVSDTTKGPGPAGFAGLVEEPGFISVTEAL